MAAHKGSVNHVSFSPDGKQIVSGSVDNIIKIWKMDGIKLIFQSSKKHDESVNAVVFSPNGKMIASASADETIELRILDGKPPTPFYVHSDAVNDIAFSADSQTVASASSDNTVMLWDIDKVQQPEKLEAEGCNMLADYLRTNTKLDKSDRQICKNFNSSK